MSYKTNLQVPISADLKAKAEKVAEKQGFSSLQELVRVFISNFTAGKVSIVINAKASPQVLEIYADDLEETKKAIDEGKIDVHKSVQDAVEKLPD